jgi:hypothetical protein
MSGLPKAVRDRPRSIISSSGDLGRADAAHAVVDAPGPEAPLGDLEAPAGPEMMLVDSGTRTSWKCTSPCPCGAS